MLLENLADINGIEHILFGKSHSEPKKKKFGFKGFTKDLTCANQFKFEIGKTYTKAAKQNPKPCSADGFHYCNNLQNVFDYFKNENGNRFCIVEILGNYTDDTDGKSVTTEIKIVSELTQEQVDNHAYEGAINLPTIKKIQQLNPFLHLGGSAALYLYGIKLDRIKEGGGQPSDIDMISPFYHFLVGDNDDKVEQSKSKNSGNDFDEGFYFNGVGVDLKVDNTQKYNIIEHDGFKYKVSQLEVIMQAKLRYSLNGNYIAVGTKIA